MKKIASSVIIVLIIILSACSAPNYSNNEKITGYNLTAPDLSVTLPGILHEISGLTYVDSTTFACIQDEKGILFIYDWKENEITKEYTFHMDGDYEGITRVGNTIYVLRSDGTLFEVTDYQSENFLLNSYVTGIPANNNEGLCYDPGNNRLLIACKGKLEKGPEFKDKRVIYGFDLSSKTMSPEPVFDFDVKEIKEFAINHKVGLPVRSKKKGTTTEPIIKFMTSDIGIHPITKKLFLLSASDHLLFIFNRNGQVEHIEPLNPELFNKAEGITFLPNGELLITNEGQDRKPTLLHFAYSM